MSTAVSLPILWVTHSRLPEAANHVQFTHFVHITNNKLFHLLSPSLVSASSLVFGFTTACCLLSRLFEKSAFLGHFSMSKNFARVYEFDPHDSKARSTDHLHGLKALLCACSIALHSIVGVVIFQSPFLYCKCVVCPLCDFSFEFLIVFKKPELVGN